MFIYLSTNKYNKYTLRITVISELKRVKEQNINQLTYIQDIKSRECNIKNRNCQNGEIYSSKYHYIVYRVVINKNIITTL